jgi:hypothetical protein
MAVKALILLIICVCIAFAESCLRRKPPLSKQVSAALKMENV